MHADTNRLRWCHWICFCLCLSPSASLSRSLYRAYKFVYPFSCQLGSAYLPNLPLISIYFIRFFLCVCVWCSSRTVALSVSFSLTHTACVKVCQNIANHWPDVKPLCEFFFFLYQNTSWEGKNTHNPTKLFVLGKITVYSFSTCVKIKLFFI